MEAAMDPWQRPPPPRWRRAFNLTLPHQFEWSDVIFQKRDHPVPAAVQCCNTCFQTALDNPDFNDINAPWKKFSLCIKKPNLLEQTMECCRRCQRASPLAQYKWLPAEKFERMWQDDAEEIGKFVVGLVLIWGFFTGAYYATKFFRRGGRRIGLNFTGLMWLGGIVLLAQWLPTAEGWTFFDVRVGLMCGALVGMVDGWDFYWEELVDGEYGD